jgi:DNA-binding response OmpR family regulator
LRTRTGALLTTLNLRQHFVDDDVFFRGLAECGIQILRLRSKLKSDPAKPRYICTERGAGYVFSARVDIIY